MQVRIGFAVKMTFIVGNNDRSVSIGASMQGYGKPYLQLKRATILPATGMQKGNIDFLIAPTMDHTTY